MRSITWTREDATDAQLEALTRRARSPGLLVVVFQDRAAGTPASWRLIEGWIRSRAVTVADVGGLVGSGALEVAVCCDLVFLREGASLGLQTAEQPLSRPLLWALGRAGHAALARGLLDGGVVAAEEAVAIGLADRLVDPDGDLPLPDGPSIAALTAARDLMRSRAVGSAGRALELATFKLLFATGDPEEGARAFLERRAARFGEGHGG